MNFFIHTLGCKVNTYESQIMSELLLNAGYTITNISAKADINIVNSCTVTSVSDSKVLKLMRKIKRENNNTILILTGCLPQAFPNDKDKFNIADIILGNTCRSNLLFYIEQYKMTRKKIYEIESHNDNVNFEKMSVHNFNERTRAFVKIEDGCNRFCSFCIIPYARGKARSKPLNELKNEIELLSKKGYKEIVLVGINLSAYGQEFDINIADAIENVCAVDGIERVRLGSLEPERMDEKTIDRLAQQKKLCPQFHLSLQSGCDDTLKRMNRHYNTDEYIKIISNIRKAFINSSITTDVMVGFPGETEEEFKKSCEFVKNVGFSKVHVFAYSRRAGTVADKAPNQIDTNTKNIRSKEMITLTNNKTTDFLISQIGQIHQVLFETNKKSGVYEGYSKNYTHIAVNSSENLCGQIRNVIITDVIDSKCHAQVL